MNIKEIMEFLPEINFYFNTVKNNLISNIVFDIGCNKESIYTEEDDIDVHYFEPYKEALDVLMTKTCLNKNSYFNN